MKIEIYTDGSARPNNGFGECGAGIVIVAPKKVYGFSRYLGKGTNNQAELNALKTGLELCLDGLSSVKNWREKATVTLLCDSEYALNSCSGVWTLTKSKKNYDLIVECQKVVKLFPKIEFMHVYGHQTNELNNWADELSVQGGEGKNEKYVRENLCTE